MRALLLASTVMLAAVPAFGANLITFSQTSGINQVAATTNVGNTQTTLTVDSALVSIGQFIAGPPPALAFFDLDATSTDAAVTFLGAVIQHYSGTFCVTTAINCGGTNLLSGSFDDAAFGALGGPGLVVNANNPPDTLNLTSDLIAASALVAPNAFSLGFTNLTPPLAIAGTTIAPFDASFAGTVSASAFDVPEPASLGLLGLGMLGVALVRRTHRGVRNQEPLPL